jgi:hypothetical protein
MLSLFLRVPSSPPLESPLLKVSVDQFSENLYIPVNDPSGDGFDISLFLWKKAEVRNKLS